ncbi:Uma2 family endonuclease [Cohnella silvisoli]|uniref:Uma2 family endonuclease n=1 Tax=Cohnella silvisoli TaxID=2873699 RepID=A0ABV1KU16_9BACL|nr:Uma2 family endonuclease [Cohnella silvisoli]MCD9023209.1 Uma2 family endonuclease [Cohnella silvisoli]
MRKEDEYPKKKKDPEEFKVKEGGLTYDDYAALDDDQRYELVDGRLELMSPGPNTLHQLISFEMAHLIANTCESEYIVMTAPLDVILSPREVRQPDLILVRRSRLHILTRRGVEGPPDLVVEILSPSTRKRDKIEKAYKYALFGIKEYWLVDPDNGVLEQNMLGDDGRYVLANVIQGDEPVNSPTLPCISFTMKEIMDKIPELR